MTEFREFHDISPLISSRMAVFPGDVAFKREVSMDFTHGDHLALSSITSTVHIGAHADAPNHYHAKGLSIEARDPKIYLGPCQVFTVELSRGERIRPNHLSQLKINASRVLFKTGSFPDPDRWNSDFNALSADAVNVLAKQGVRLIGIDTPSIDLAEDQILESHQAVYSQDMAILEGLVLESVADGSYWLSALPLKIKDADASPVRAVLWRM